MAAGASSTGQEAPRLQPRAAVQDGEALGVLAVEALVRTREDLQAAERDVRAPHDVKANVDARVDHDEVAAREPLHSWAGKERRKSS